MGYIRMKRRHHLETFCGGESVEGPMRNRWIRVRPGHLRVEMTTTTRSCNIIGDRHQAGVRGKVAGPLRKSGNKTGILTETRS